MSTQLSPEEFVRAAWIPKFSASVLWFPEEEAEIYFDSVADAGLAAYGFVDMLRKSPAPLSVTQKEGK